MPEPLQTTRPEDFTPPTMRDLLAPREPRRPQNPYLDRLLSRPQLTQGPLEGSERSLTDRFFLGVEAGYRQTFLGAGEAAMLENLPGEYDPSNPMEAEHRLRMDEIRQGQREYDAMRPSRTPLEYTVAITGHLLGAARSPETLVGLPSRFVTAGRTALSRVLRAGTAGAAINTAIDPVVQALRMNAGLQDRYEPAQTALSALFGVALPGVVQTVAEAARPIMRQAPDIPVRREEPEPTPEMRPREAEQVVDEPTTLTSEEALERIDNATTTLRREADRIEAADDVAEAFPPIRREPEAPPIRELEIEGRRIVFPDGEHARLFQLGKALVERRQVDPVEVRSLLEAFRGFVVEEEGATQFQNFRDVGELALEYFRREKEQSGLRDAPRRAGDVLADEDARAAWRQRQLEREEGPRITERQIRPDDDVLPPDSLPVVRPQNVQEYIAERIGQSREIADRAEVTGLIARSAFQERTAQQTANELGDRLPVEQSERTSFIREVRASLGIPSMDSLTEFRAWQEQYRGQLGAARGGIEAAPDPIGETRAAVERPLPEQDDAVLRADLDEKLSAGLPEEQIAEHPLVQRAVAEMRAVPATHEHPDFGTDAWWSNRRFRVNGTEVVGAEAVRRHIATRFFSMAWADDGLTFAPGQVRAEREAVLVLGPPAAGKSRIANPIARAKAAAIIDADEIKKMLPEYGNGVGASAVHEESSLIARNVLSKFLAKGVNVVLPKVTGSEKLLTELKSAGYRVSVVNMAVAPDEAFRRMIRRFLKTGRLVNTGYMRGIGTSPRDSYISMRDGKRADAFAEIDNNGLDAQIIEDIGEVLAGIELRRPGRESGTGGGLGGRAREGTGPDVPIRRAGGGTAGPEVESIGEFTTADIPPTPNQRAGLYTFDPRDLRVDAERFQFKSGGDVEGVTPILRSVSRWDPDAAGQLIVWQGADGSTFVADGHQRVGLARRLLEGGDETDIQIPAMLYRESDGFSAEDVMVLAALKNIKEGSGDIMDAARILRLRPEKIEGISEISRTQTRQAVALANLSDETFRMAINGVIEPRDAAIIGRIIPADPAQQEAAARVVARVKPTSEAEAEILVRRTRDSELVRTERGAQASLLGEIENPESLVAEETRIVAAATRLLARDRSLMNRVVRQAERIEETGSRIEREAAAGVASEAAMLSQMIESLAFTRGVARDKLLELARGLRDGSLQGSEAAESFVEAVRLATRVSDRGGVEAGGRGRSDAAPGQDAPRAEATIVGTGTRLRSVSGRELAPAPKIDLGTPKKAANTLKRVDAWLVSEAIADAEAAGNDFVLTQFRGLDAAKLSPADRDSLNQYLFGSTAGATADNLVVEPIAAMRMEAGADGRPQAVIPGAEQATEAQVAQRRADAPLRPKAAQQGDAGPLFGDGNMQMDLVDMARAAGQRDRGKTDLFGFVGARRGTPLLGETDRSSTGVAAGRGPQAERLKEISQRVVDALGITVRQGRMTLRGAQGEFKARAGVARLKELDAFDVLAHEGGHGLHMLPANRAAIDGLIAAHVGEVEPLAYQGAKAGTERAEGFAEWFRLWLTNPRFAAREAPNFTAGFTQWMETNRGEQFRQLLDAQGAYRDWLQAPSRDLVTGDLVTAARPPLPPRIAKALGPDRMPTGESLFSFFDRFYTWTLDTLHPANRGTHAFLDIEHRNTGVRRELKAAENPYKLLRLATNAYQAGHMDLSYGVVPYRRLDPEGPSLAEGLELAVGKNWFGYWRSDDMLDFGGYLVARRSVVEFERFLAGEVPNPPGKLTLGDYRQAVADYEAQHPSFARAAAMVYEWQTNLLKKKFEAGLVSRSFYEGSLARADYVPFRRDFSEKVDELIQNVGVGGTNRQSVMKGYRGSMRSIINPIESMIADSYDTAAIIARNDAFKAMADMARRAGYGGGAIAEEIPSHQIKSVSVDLVEAMRAAGKDAGLARDDIDELIRQATETLDADNIKTTLYRAGEAPDKGEPIVYFWEGGERKALRLADGRFGRDLYESMTQIGGEQSNWMINMLAVPARALRMGITTSPEFLIANYTRDQIAAFVLNTRFIPFVSGARGAAVEIAQGKAARLYAQAGGVMGGANVASLDQARIGRSITALQKKGYSIRRMADPREFLKLTEISETGTRIALFRQYFDQARKNGLNEYESLIEAAFQARDYMDFGRHGSKMLFARRIVTFMNAAMQGTDKTLRVLVGDLRPLARVFRGESLTATERRNLGRSAQAWAKISAITALSATYAALYKDDPEWQEASEYLRATHWLFKAPGGEWVAIPKPYEMATIMNLGERAAEGIMSEDPTWADRWMRSWGYTLTIPMEPAGLMVPAEVMFNYDTFRDRPIVPQWDMGKEPALQFNAYTSEFSKALGKAINVSPAKIDHMIVGWAGSWGRNILSASNAALDPQRRSEMLYDWPITGRFVKNLARGSDATDKFYGLISETAGRLELKNNTFKAFEGRGQEQEAASYYDGLRDDEKAWVALNAQKSADNKRLHPLRRASDVAQVLSGMRRDILNRNVVNVLTDEKITVNPTMANAINDQIARVSAMEMRNALIAVGEPGWSQRDYIDPAPSYTAIRALSPEVADEIESRFRKRKVLPFEGVRLVWPELRRRLLRDGTDAFITDLRGDALNASTPVRREPVSEGDPFQGVMLDAR